MTQPLIAWIAEVDSDGNIKQIFSVGADIPPDRQVWVNGYVAIHILTADLETLGFESPQQFMSENSWNGTAWVNRGTKPGEYYIWNNEWVIDTVRLHNDIRLERLYKFASSDWTQFNDSPLSDEKRAEWRTYRQALRDIMTNLPANLDDPNNVTWPTEPT